MPQTPRVLSTDPNAGTPLRGGDGPRVLSTDPNAGEPLRVNSRARRIAVDTAAPIGGMIGGIAGGVPGAAIGGAAGQGYAELIQHAGDIPGAVSDVAGNLIDEPMATMKGMFQGAAEGAGNAAKAAGLEGVSQFAGNQVVKAGGVMAKWLMNRATSRVSAKLMREFPDLADTLIDEALTVSKGGEQKARAMLSAAKAKTATALAKADASGATIPVQMTPEIAESFKTELVERMIKSRGLQPSEGAITAARNRLPPEMRALFQQIDDAASARGPLELKPSQADMLKTRLQRESRPVYAQRGAPNGPTAVGMEASEKTELADQINSAIDAVSDGYKASNAEARPLIGAVRGIKQAIRPNGNLYQAMVRPAVGGIIGAGAGSKSDIPGGSALGAIAGAAMTSPAGMSREAILLASPQMQAVLRQLPRATALALEQFLRARSTGQTQPPAPPAGGAQ